MHLGYVLLSAEKDTFALHQCVCVCYCVSVCTCFSLIVPRFMSVFCAICVTERVCVCVEWFLLGPVEDVDAVVRLYQLTVAVPAARNVSRGDLTVERQRLTQQNRHVRQILENLQRLH